MIRLTFNLLLLICSLSEGSCGSEKKMSLRMKNSGSILSPSNRATYQCGCGRVPAISRIVGGKVSQKHSRPYQGYLTGIIKGKEGHWSCGATLLNMKYALTAAHCVNASQVTGGAMTLTLGEHDTSAKTETINVQKIKVSAIVHPKYKDETLNDIAILKLLTPAKFNKNVVPACLPTDKSKTYIGMDAVVSGWGLTAEKGSTSSVLKETTVKVIPNTAKECLKSTEVKKVDAGKLCTYKKGTDQCSGDSGGPLVVSENGRLTVIGAVSGGFGCARTGYAGYFARVTYYLDWINSLIKDGWCTGTSSTIKATTAAATTTVKTSAAVTTTVKKTTVMAPTDDSTSDLPPPPSDYYNYY